MADIDYDALAAKFGGKDAASGVDYDALAAKFGGKDAPSKPGIVSDVVQTLPGIIPRAAAGLAGLPQAVLRGRDAIVGYVADKLGIDPQEATRRMQQADLVSPSLGATTWLLRRAPDLGQMVEGGWDEISKLVSGKPLYKPQTPAGRIVDTTGQVMVSGPGSLTQKAVTGAAAAVSGEGARLVTDNPVLIGIAQLLGGSAASLPFILRSVPADNINQAIKNISPQDLAKAQKLMDDATAMGSPITGAEAIAQVTGKNTLQDIQRVVEGSKEGAPIMQPMMNARPDANRRAFTTAADQIAPGAAKPAETPVRVQQAASGAIREARQAGNAAAKPAYDAAAQQQIPASEWNSLTQDPAVQKALSAVKSDPMWGVANEAEGSIRWLDAAKRWIDDELVGAKPSVSRILGDAKTKMLTVADAASPDYAAARSTVAQNRQTVVKPMDESPVGDLARTGSFPGAPRPNAEAMMKEQAGILMPQAPRALDPQTIKTTIATLNKQDPTAASQWTRQNLEALFNEATQNNVGGANQWGGAKFAAQLAGNPAQKDNLQALVESVGGKRAWAGFNRFLDVMEAQGKRQAPGSPTAQNAMIQGDLSAAGPGAVAAIAGSPGRASTALYDWYQRFRFGKNTAEMAQILTDPKSVDLMRELARHAPNSAKATSIVAQIVAGNADASRGSEDR